MIPRTGLRSILFAALASACAQPTELAVDLHTDLIPGLEFSEVRTRLEQRPEVRSWPAPDPASLRWGARVAEYGGLEPVADVLTLELWHPSGVPIATIARPVEIDGASAITAHVMRRPQMLAGHGVSCARLGARVWCWGAAGRVLGGLRTGEALAPYEVWGRMRDVCSSQAETCFLSERGTLACVNAPAEAISSYAEADHGPHGHVELECGAIFGLPHRCMRAEGGVTCSGFDTVGQVGDGAPETTSGLVDDVVVRNAQDAVVLAGGAIHTCAVTRGGQVRCWGANNFGQLGDGSMEGARHAPALVQNLSDAVTVDTFWTTTCAIDAHSALHCWGGNGSQQIVEGDAESVRQATAVPRPGPVRQIAVGRDHICAQQIDGRVVCWGANGQGQLGDGTTTDRVMPVAVPLGGNVLAIDAGGDHTCAILERQERISVACWGSNTAGELGLPPSAAVRVPTEFELPGL